MIFPPVIEQFAVENYHRHSDFSDWWLSYPSEKYESQLGLLFPTYGQTKVMFQTTNQLLFFPITFSRSLAMTKARTNNHQTRRKGDMDVRI